MKRLISAFLAVVILCLSLTACADRIIGEDLADRKDKNTNEDELEVLNMYVIVDDNTGTSAIDTVTSNINVYLKEIYDVQLNLIYCKESEYEEKVMDSLADGVKEPDRADIILINSAEMFDTLYYGNKLAPLTSFYNHKDYLELNDKIEDNLLAGSVINTVVPGENGAPDKTAADYYTVPNNHRIGDFQYIVIDKATTREIPLSSGKIAAMNDSKDVAQYQATLGENAVKLVVGDYETKLYLEYGFTNLADLKEAVKATYDSSLGLTVEEYVEAYSEIVTTNGENFVKAPLKKVNYVNIAAYPSATKNEAYSSAYAVVKSLDDTGKLKEEDATRINKHYTKCLNIIFALNNDPELRNLLQYGCAGTYYDFVKDQKGKNTNYITIKGQAASSSDDKLEYYYMDLFYTGNYDIAYYCEEQGWNASVHSNVKKHNAASYTLAKKVSEESDLIKELNGKVYDLTDTDTYSDILKDNGIKHGDVTVNWTCSSDKVKLEVVNNALSIVPATQLAADVEKTAETVSITLTATLSCADTCIVENAETGDLEVTQRSDETATVVAVEINVNVVLYVAINA